MNSPFLLLPPLASRTPPHPRRAHDMLLTFRSLPDSSGRALLSLHFTLYLTFCLGRGYFMAKCSPGYKLLEASVNFEYTSGCLKRCFLIHPKHETIAHWLDSFDQDIQKCCSAIFRQSTLRANLDLHTKVQSNENTLLF